LIGAIAKFKVIPKVILIKEGRDNTKISFFTILIILFGFLRQIWFSLSYGISMYNPLNVFIKPSEKLNIAALIPELQPYVNELDDTFKFVGPCVSEQVRNYEISDDDELKSVLDQFENKTPQSNIKFIYMSLGTVFNFNSFIFEKAIEALRDYNKNSHRRFDSSQFRVVISTGEETFKSLTEKISRGELELPKNVLIRPKVPQLKILKRADLFITHCGMNSTSEAIKYAVPMVCIPLDADQPLVAKRVSDDLSLGIRLNPVKLNVAEIADSIDRVLSDDKYKKNIEELSRVSAKYNGSVEGARLIIEFLNEKKPDSKKRE